MALVLQNLWSLLGCTDSWISSYRVGHTDYWNCQVVGGVEAQQGMEMGSRHADYWSSLWNSVQCHKMHLEVWQWYTKAQWKDRHVCQFFPRSVRAYSSERKYNVTNEIYFEVGLTCVDELTVHYALFFHEDAGNLQQGLKMLGKLLRIRLDCGWSWSEFPMFVWWEVDRKLEFPTKSNKTVGKICIRNGGTILHVKEEEDGLHSNPNRTAFIAHYFWAFVEVAVDSFNYCGVVIATRENMSIELKEVACLFEGTKELDILVQEDSATEPIS